MKRWFGLRACSGLVAIGTALLVSVPPVLANPVTGAGFTTVNVTVDGTGHCQNGNPDINCNIYDGKQFVWLNGGPSTAYVGDGTYFFAVLVPGGQHNPNDGGANNLSDTTADPYGAGASNADGSSIPSGDAYTNRTFTVTGGTVSYSGSHTFDNNKIRLMPYDDTTNNGGVYIMAICQIDPNTYDPVSNPVDPRDCKYDAFKVEQGGGVSGQGQPLTVTKDANGSYDKTFKWNITKDVDATKVVTSGGTATFTYTVSVSHDAGTVSNVKVTGTIDVFNPNVDSSNNTLPVTIDGITDHLSNGTGCAVTNGGSQTLTLQHTLFAYSCNLSGLPNGDLTNFVSLSWPEQFLDNGDHLFGSTATFTSGVISFAENDIDECVNVTDTFGGALGKVCVGDANPTKFTYTHDVTGTGGTCVNADNTATFTTTDTGATGSDSKSVSLCKPIDLTVTKTATPTYTRTYLWDIKKAVDKTRVSQNGGSVTFNYTVTATETGFTDSSIQVAGTITVSNPNDFEDIQLTGVTDATDNTGICSITDINPTPTVPMGGSVTLHYVCTYGAPLPADGFNTATVTWDKAAANTPNGSASGVAGIHFGDPTTRKNQNVTVTDSFNGGAPTTLGTCGPATDGAPFKSCTFNYPRTIQVIQNTCVTYPNTATITETGQNDSQSVTVCGGVVGGLTMGFWQNKNGQGIITSGTSTGGVCNSGTWLRQYLPFQDLSATATCAQVAAYVYNVIKLANSSGTSMNPMLKAQMLATALDVYFSTPTLGGNRINAPTPLGGVNVDLTQICKMLDGSGGGSCSGFYQNVSAAFGGATCLSVSQLLAYAASQSNVGGTAWYGQNKSTQELAKNTFDAINNSAAFAC